MTRDDADYIRSQLTARLEYRPETGALVWKGRYGSVTAGTVAGTLDHVGYRRVLINRKAFYAHRLVWLLFHGQWPDFELDHVNGDKSDNRIDNLRPANRSLQMGNAPVRRDNKLGVKGVSYREKSGRYRASITKNGNRIHLGYYDTAEAASRAYARAATALFGDYARPK